MPRRCGEGAAETLHTHPDPPGDDGTLTYGDHLDMPDQDGGGAEGSTVEEAAAVLSARAGVLAILAGHRRWWERLHFVHRCWSNPGTHALAAGTPVRLPWIGCAHGSPEMLSDGS